MKKLFTLALLAVLFVACTKNDGEYTIKAKLNLPNVWTSVASKLETNGDPTARMGMYIFDDNDAYVGLMNREMVAATDFTATTSRITTAGRYTLYGYAYLPYADLLHNTDANPLTPSSVFTISEPRDICLGSQEITVISSQLNYTTTITLNHIMAQLALSVTGVPADINAISVTLPSQSNQFSFDGTFTGTNATQTIDLTRAATADANGNYTWSFPETIVFPCAAGTTSMPITVVATDATHTYTFNTASTTCCTSTTRTVLTTTWSTLNYFVTGDLSIQPWTTVTQSGSFILGNPSVN